MTLVDGDTGEVLVVISAEAARELTDRIKVGVEGVWLLVIAAFKSRAWAALGYSSWDDYCLREFGASHIRLPREEKPEVTMSLRDAGFSLRAIASATGDSVRTVRRTLSGVANATPDEETRVSGTDGKTYRARSTATPAVMDHPDDADDEPVEPILFKSRAAVEARVARAKEMAAAGSTSRQIAKEIGIGLDSIGPFRERHGIDVPADRVVGNTSRIDPNRILNETVLTLEGLVLGVDLVQVDDLDPARVAEWAASLDASLRSLNQLVKHLKEMARGK